MKGDLKAIQQRIKTVEATKKIATVMGLIASSKYQICHKLLANASIYNKHMVSIVNNYFNNIALTSSDIYKPALFKNNVNNNKILVICVSSDKGLCGNFNQLINNSIDNFVTKHQNKKISVLAIGSRVEKHIKNKHKSDITLIPHKWSLDKNLEYEHFAIITSLIVNFFLQKEFETVYMIFSRFISSVKRDIISEVILPIIPQNNVLIDDKKISTAYEPNSRTVIEDLSYQMIRSIFYYNMISSYVSEHCVRMLAMDSASRNANDISDKLMLERNSMRQNSITTELLEIISGSEAINDGNI